MISQKLFVFCLLLMLLTLGCEKNYDSDCYYILKDEQEKKFPSTLLREGFKRYLYNRDTLPSEFIGLSYDSANQYMTVDEEDPDCGEWGTNYMEIIHNELSGQGHKINIRLSVYNSLYISADSLKMEFSLDQIPNITGSFPLTYKNTATKDSAKVWYSIVNGIDSMNWYNKKITWRLLP